MKNFILILFLSILFTASSKENLVPNRSFVNSFDYPGDSTQHKSKFLSERNTNHQFILDAEIGIRINYGVNYFYRLERWRLGGRVGFTTYISKQSFKYGERLYFFYPEILVNYMIYRTVNAEIGLGSEYTNFNGYKNPNITGRVGFQLTIFKYLFLRGGIQLSFDTKYKTTSPYPVFGLGITI
ncbi:hypothetical protein D3C87_63630 [compost metagenome]